MTPTPPLAALRSIARLALVGRLTSALAHELGTPLNVVSARAQMIERGLTRESSLSADARNIKDKVTFMAEAIRRVHAFATPSDRPQPLTDLAVAVEWAAALLEPLARKRRITISTTRLGASDSMGLDTDAAVQLVAELVLNGIDAQPDGGAVRIEIGGDDVALCVEDDGPGIAEEIRSRVFELFFTTKPHGIGTGLGLPIGQGIVAGCGGAISLCEGTGATRFEVRFATTRGARP